MNRLSSPARLAAGAVALVAWVGLAVQFRASLAQLGGAPETLWVMLRYFTVIANGLSAILLSAVALGWGGLVGVVYGLLLRGMLELSGGAKLADTLMHLVTPVLVPAYWLVFVPKGSLRRGDPLLWAVLPLVYFVYALGRGALDGVYAYPFMNVVRLGWPQTAANAAIIALGFLAAGYGLLRLDRRLAGRPRPVPTV